MFRREFVLALAILTAASPGATADAGLGFGFGEGSGEVGFLNASNVTGNVGMPLPRGPSAFRMLPDGPVVLDAVGARLVGLDRRGAPRGEVGLPTGEGRPWLGDLAVRLREDGGVHSFWVVDNLDASLLVLDPAGRPLGRVGGATRGEGLFRRPHRLEIGPSGRVYVQDDGLQQILVLDHQGRLQERILCSGRGLFLDRHETLYRLDWSETARRVRLRRRRLDGKELRPVPLAVRAVSCPELWAVLPGGETLVTFLARDAGPGQHKLVRFGPDGRRRGLVDLAVPAHMVRFLEPAERGAVWVARGDLSAAPGGELAIERLELTGESEG